MERWSSCPIFAITPSYWFLQLFGEAVAAQRQARWKRGINNTKTQVSPSLLSSEKIVRVNPQLKRTFNLGQTTMV